MTVGRTMVWVKQVVTKTQWNDYMNRKKEQKRIPVKSAAEPPNPVQHVSDDDEGFLGDIMVEEEEKEKIENEIDDPPPKFTNKNPESGNDTSDEDEVVILNSAVLCCRQCFFAIFVN